MGEQWVGRPGIAGWDPLRIVIDVRGTGLTGYEVASALRASYDIHVELATYSTMVLVLGIGQPVEPLDRVAHDLAESVKRIAPSLTPGPVALDQTPAPASSTQPPADLDAEPAVPPREAFLGISEAVSVEQAVGRISTEAIAGYPPGVPTLLPGERVTADVVSYLRALVDTGARLHGAADPSFRTLRVLVSQETAATKVEAISALSGGIVNVYEPVTGVTVCVIAGPCH